MPPPEVTTASTTTDTTVVADTKVADTPVEKTEVKTESTPEKTTEVKEEHPKPKDEDIFFEFDTETGKRKVTLKDWKTQQDHTRKQAETVKAEKAEAAKQQAKTAQTLDLLQRHMPDAYSQLQGLLNRDPNVVTKLPPEIQADLIIAQREEAKEAKTRETQAATIRTQRAKDIETRLDGMAKDNENFPNYDEEALINFAMEYHIPDPEIAWKAMDYDRLKTSLADKISKAKEEAIVEFQKDVHDRKKRINAPGPVGEKVKPITSANTKSARDRLRERAKELGLGR